MPEVSCWRRVGSSAGPPRGFTSGTGAEEDRRWCLHLGQDHPGRAGRAPEEEGEVGRVVAAGIPVDG